jgi:hypothetical protein
LPLFTFARAYFLTLFFSIVLSLFLFLVSIGAVPNTHGQKEFVHMLYTSNDTHAQIYVYIFLVCVC